MWEFRAVEGLGLKLGWESANEWERYTYSDGCLYLPKRKEEEKTGTREGIAFTITPGWKALPCCCHLQAEDDPTTTWVRLPVFELHDQSSDTPPWSASIEKPELWDFPLKSLWIKFYHLRI